MSIVCVPACDKHVLDFLSMIPSIAILANRSKTIHYGDIKTRGEYQNTSKHRLETPVAAKPAMQLLLERIRRRIRQGSCFIRILWRHDCVERWSWQRMLVIDGALSNNKGENSPGPIMDVENESGYIPKLPPFLCMLGWPLSQGWRSIIVLCIMITGVGPGFLCYTPGHSRAVCPGGVS